MKYFNQIFTLIHERNKVWNYKKLIFNQRNKIPTKLRLNNLKSNSKEEKCKWQSKI